MNPSFFYKSAITVLVLMGILLCGHSVASAHTIFKQQLQKKYPGLSIKCEVCHIKGKEKTEANDFGKLFVEELVEHDLIDKWKALEGDKKEAFEQETMAPVFDKAFEKIKLLKNDECKVWHDIFDAGEMENTKLKRGKTKGTEGLGEENAGGDDDDDADDGEKKDAEKKDGDKKDSEKKKDGDKMVIRFVTGGGVWDGTGSKV